MKGIEFLFRIYENLSLPRPRLLMVGPEPTAIGSPSGVELMARVPLDKLIELYSESTCLAVPSQWPENCSMTILEAMSCQLPVLASNVGGNAELVRHNSTGFLLPRDSIESWTNAIERLLANQNLVDRLGKSARANVLKELSIRTTISKHMELYAQLAH